jgi:uncharacterized protein (DUF58 family)
MNWKNINTPRLILLVTLLFTAFGAGVFRTAPVLFMAATLCGAPIVGFFASRISSRGLKISRQIPESGMVGDEIRLRLTIRNNGRIPAFLICALGFVELKVARKPRYLFAGKRSINGRDLQGQPLPADVIEIVGEPNIMVPLLMPRTQVVEELRWRLLRRGAYVLGGAAVGALDPIGLYSHFPIQSKPTELIILPRPLRLQRLELYGGGQGGEKPLGIASVAEAADLHGVRPHQSGEGLRRVHWKATARTGVLHVVEWEEENASDTVVLLDVQAANIEGDKDENTLERAIVAAATVAAYCVENSQRVQIFWLEDDGEKFRLVSVQARHRQALADVLMALAKIKPCENVSASLGALSQEARKSCPDFDSALLLGSVHTDFEFAWRQWGMVAKGKALAFSYEPSEVKQKSNESKKERLDKEKNINKETLSDTSATYRHSKSSNRIGSQELGVGNFTSKTHYSARTIHVGRFDSIATALERIL